MESSCYSQIRHLIEQSYLFQTLKFSNLMCIFLENLYITMIKHTILKNKIFPLKCRKFQFKSYHGKHRNMLIKTVNCHISCYDFIVIV